MHAIAAVLSGFGNLTVGGVAFACGLLAGGVLALEVMAGGFAHSHAPSSSDRATPLQAQASTATPAGVEPTAIRIAGR